MILLVTGDRNWLDEKFVVDVISKIHQTNPIQLLVNGACRGADECSSFTSRKLHIPYKELPADWKQYAKSAGPIRNHEMLDTFHPTDVAAFHDNIKSSAGTRHMCAIAKRQGLRVVVYSHQHPEGVEFE
jgi:hypothetical protein